MNTEAEQMIEAYQNWLNKWAQHNDPPADIFILTREDFDEFDDPPRILLDEVVLSGTIYARRFIVLICSPYHDEGGPTILTGLFDADDESNFWILDEMLQEFDTQVQSIFHEGKLTTLPEETKIVDSGDDV